jgi:hypothetical protein
VVAEEEEEEEELLPGGNTCFCSKIGKKCLLQ